MPENEEMASPQSVGLTIEPDYAPPYGLVLKLGTSRFECILELDHPDFVIGGGHLDAAFTLDCWLSELERLSAGDGSVALLPFNFSDQCTGWLRIRLTRDGFVDVQAGWSSVSQYALAPSDLTAASFRILDFEPVRNARIERSLDGLVAAVATLRASFAVSPGERAGS